MCSDDTQMPSTPTFAMSSFLVRAFSNQWTVKVDDDGICYGFARIGPGHQFSLSPSGSTYSHSSPTIPAKVNRDCTFTRMDTNQNLRQQPAAGALG